jgi:hypothetical protein
MGVAFLRKYAKRGRGVLTEIRKTWAWRSYGNTQNKGMAFFQKYSKLGRGVLKEIRKMWAWRSYLVFWRIVELWIVSLRIAVVEQMVVDQVPAPALVIAAEKGDVAVALESGKQFSDLGSPTLLENGLTTQPVFLVKL